MHTKDSENSSYYQRRVTAHVHAIWMRGPHLAGTDDSGVLRHAPAEAGAYRWRLLNIPLLPRWCHGMDRDTILQPAAPKTPLHPRWCHGMDHDTSLEPAPEPCGCGVWPGTTRLASHSEKF